MFKIEKSSHNFEFISQWIETVSIESKIIQKIIQEILKNH